MNTYFCGSLFDTVDYGNVIIIGGKSIDGAVELVKHFLHYFSIIFLIYKTD